MDKKPLSLTHRSSKIQPFSFSQRLMPLPWPMRCLPILAFLLAWRLHTVSRGPSRSSWMDVGCWGANHP